MRLLLISIVSSFCFIAPLQCSAGDARMHPLATEGRQFPKVALTRDITNLDFAAIITPSSNSYGSNTRCKSFSFTNFINTVGFISNSISCIQRKHFVDPYPSHQPIALKLLFPKHYFW